MALPGFPIDQYLQFQHLRLLYESGMPLTAQIAAEIYEAQLYIYRRIQGGGTAEDPNGDDAAYADTGGWHSANSRPTAERGHRHGYNLIRASPSFPIVPQSNDRRGRIKVGEHDAKPAFGQVWNAALWGYDYGAQTSDGDLGAGRLPSDTDASTVGLWAFSSLFHLSDEDALGLAKSPSTAIGEIGWFNNSIIIDATGKIEVIGHGLSGAPFELQIPPVMNSAGALRAKPVTTLYNPNVALDISVKGVLYAPEHSTWAFMQETEILAQTAEQIIWDSELTLWPTLPTTMKLLIYIEIGDGPPAKGTMDHSIRPIILTHFSGYEST